MRCWQAPDDERPANALPLACPRARGRTGGAETTFQRFLMVPLRVECLNRWS